MINKQQMSSSSGQLNNTQCLDCTPVTKKKQQTINMLQTHYSLTASNEEQNGDTLSNKMNSFKKIKAGYVQEKNNNGKIVKKTIHNSFEENYLKQALPNGAQQCINQIISNFVERLDDAVTIYSQDSHRQSESEYSEHVQIDDDSLLFLSRAMANSPLINKSPDRLMSHNTSQKQIIFPSPKKYYTLPNEDISQFDEESKNNNFDWLFNQNKHKLVSMNVVKENPLLSIEETTRALFHLEIINCNFKELPIMNQEWGIIVGLLHIYAVVPIKRLSIKSNSGCFCTPPSNDKQYVVIYEPYSETLTEYILKTKKIGYSQMSKLFVQLIQILSQLTKKQIYIEIDPFNVVHIYGEIKIKLKHEQGMNRSKVFVEKDMIRSIGIYLNAHFKLIYHRDGNNVVSKIEGLGMFKRIQIKNLIDDIIKQKVVCMDDLLRRTLATFSH